MQKYSDTVLDTNGNVIRGATVTVQNYPAGTSATVYGSNAIGANVNPLTTDANGYFEFYAPNGAYSLQVTKTGVTTRTVTNILIQDINVSIMEYGAKVDGVTNDFAAVQAAIDAVYAAGGGNVLFPPGTCLVSCSTSGIGYRDNVNLIGAGRGASIVKLKSGSTLTSSHGVIEPFGYGVLSVPASGYYTKNNTVSNLTIDGNSAGNSGTYECLVACNVKNFFVQNCEALGATEAGFHLQRHSLGSDLNTQVAAIGCISHDCVIDGYQIQGAILESCYAYSNAIGIHSAANYNGGGDLTNIVTRISNCEATGNSSAGVVHDLQFGNPIALLMENTMAHHNGAFGMTISALNDVCIVNCSARYNTGAGVHGLYVLGDRVTITGGNYSNNGGAGIYVDGNRTRVVITGIVANSNGTYGVQIISPNAGADNILSNCSLTGNTTAAVSVLAASKWNLINNVGLNPVGAFGNYGNPANPTVGASPVTIANTYGYPILLTVTGGTVSSISINGIATGMTSGAFVVSPEAPGHLAGGGTLSIAYTVAPTVQAFGL